jgi:serine/threonine protein kinase
MFANRVQSDPVKRQGDFRRMVLAKGSRVGFYEIVSAIGAGGMGEVFRARDTRLNRDVATKVLPAAFAHDRERVARFRRRRPNWGQTRKMKNSGPFTDVSLAFPQTPTRNFLR